MRHLLLLVLLAGCDKGTPCQSDLTCGEMQACVPAQNGQGYCEDVDCLSSLDCELENFCNLDTHTCDPGCEFSTDCLTADRCDAVTATCVERRCTDTQRDCDVGERCNTSTGQCQVDPAPHCQPCSSSTQCGSEGECWGLVENAGGFCLLSCSPEAFDPCPAGLQCTFVEDGYHVCVGLCHEF